MALLFLEGFEGIVPSWLNGLTDTKVATEEYMASIYGGINIKNSSQFHLVKSQDGRSHALGTGTDVDGDGLYFERFFTPIPIGTKIYIGWRVKFQETDREIELVRILNNNKPDQYHVLLKIVALRKFELLDFAATQLDISAADAFTANTWSYLELMIEVGSSTGEYELKMDGVSIFSGTAVDTLNSPGGSSMAGVRWTGGDATSTSYESIYMLDDLYICDDTTTVNNTFLGDIKVYETVINEEGSSVDFSSFGSIPSTINSINNRPMSLTEGIESIDTLGKAQLFKINPFHTTGIVGVSLTTFGTTSGPIIPVNLINRVQSGATSDETADHSVVDKTTFLGLISTSGLDPNTSAAWTQVNLNSTEFGVEIG